MSNNSRIELRDADRKENPNHLFVAMRGHIYALPVAEMPTQNGDLKYNWSDPFWVEDVQRKLDNNPKRQQVKPNSNDPLLMAGFVSRLLSVMCSHINGLSKSSSTFPSAKVWDGTKWADYRKTVQANPAFDMNKSGTGEIDDPTAPAATDKKKSSTKVVRASIYTNPDQLTPIRALMGVAEHLLGDRASAIATNKGLESQLKAATKLRDERIADITAQIAVMEAAMKSAKLDALIPSATSGLHRDIADATDLYESSVKGLGGVALAPIEEALNATLEILKLVSGVLPKETLTTLVGGHPLLAVLEIEGKSLIGVAPTTTEPTEPTTEPTEPTTEPTVEVAVEPTEPTTEPTVEVAVEPTVEPTEPTTEPTVEVAVEVTAKAKKK